MSLGDYLAGAWSPLTQGDEEALGPWGLGYGVRSLVDHPTMDPSSRVNEGEVDKMSDFLDDHHKSLGYSVRLLIRHPNVDPALITKELGLEPHLAWHVGAPRRTATGALLPGRHKHSTWSYSYFVEGNRAFTKDIDEMLDRLEPHANFLLHLSKDAHGVHLILGLEGERNIGDDIGWQLLKRLADLRVDLGIEVFPKTDRRIPG